MNKRMSATTRMSMSTGKQIVLKSNGLDVSSGMSSSMKRMSMAVPASSAEPLFNRLNYDAGHPEPPATTAREWFAWISFDFLNSPFFVSCMVFGNIYTYPSFYKTSFYL